MVNSTIRLLDGLKIDTFQFYEFKWGGLNNIWKFSSYLTQNANAALRRADPPSKQSCRLCLGLWNWKSGLGPTNGSRAIDEWMNVCLHIRGKTVRQCTHEHNARHQTGLYIHYATQIKCSRNVGFSACDCGSWCFLTVTSFVGTFSGYVLSWQFLHIRMSSNQSGKHGMSERNIPYVSLIPRMKSMRAWWLEELQPGSMCAGATAVWMQPSALWLKEHKTKSECH
jgi:hypothetical protein